MTHIAARASVVVLLLLTGVSSSGPQEQPKRVQVVEVLRELVKRSTLAEPGGEAFYLRANVRDKMHADWEYNAEAEEYWASPTKWRRTIRSKRLSQTLIGNVDHSCQQKTGHYFPPAFQKLLVSL